MKAFNGLGGRGLSLLTRRRCVATVLLIRYHQLFVSRGEQEISFAASFLGIRFLYRVRWAKVQATRWRRNVSGVKSALDSAAMAMEIATVILGYDICEARPIPR